MIAIVTIIDDNGKVIEANKIVEPFVDVKQIHIPVNVDEVSREAKFRFSVTQRLPITREGVPCQESC